MPSTVELVTKKGERFKSVADSAKGSPENPWPKKEIEKKFLEMANMIKKPDENKEILEKIQKMDQLNNILELSNLLQL
jgi:2-methylcitrate dehydratase PrpD